MSDPLVRLVSFGVLRLHGLGHGGALGAMAWIVSLAGFVVAALIFWFTGGDAWRVIAIGSAVVSGVGVILFFGTWPMFNTLTALVVDAAVLVPLVALRWAPPPA